MNQKKQSAPYSFNAGGWFVLANLGWYSVVLGGVIVAAVIAVIGLTVVLYFNSQGSESMVVEEVQNIVFQVMNGGWATAFYLFLAFVEILLIIPLIIYEKATRGGLRRVFGARVQPGQVLIGALMGICAIPLAQFLVIVTSVFFGSSDVTQTSLYSINNGFELAVAMLCIGIPAAIVEEPIFRGMVQRAAAARLKKWPALMLTAAMFSLFHLNLISMPVLFIAGLLLGLLFWETGSLWPCVAMHCVYNMGVTAMDFAFMRVWQNYGDIGWLYIAEQAPRGGQLALACLVWLAAAMVFSCALAGLFYWNRKIRRPSQALCVQPREQLPEARKGWHWTGWIISGVVMGSSGAIMALMLWLMPKLTELMGG